MKRLAEQIFFMMALSLIICDLSWSAKAVEAKKGKKDLTHSDSNASQVYYENGFPVKIVTDSDKDGQADEIIHIKNGHPDIGEADENKDGKIDRWKKYDSLGNVIMIAYDRHVDGKPDYWTYFKEDSIYLREWDRNFDGKSDFRTYERNHQLLEKQYDDNFDGKFEKIEKAPKKGSSGRTKTTAVPN